MIADEKSSLLEDEEKRTLAELQYYEDNNCYPAPCGYFGTETDSHFYER